MRQALRIIREEHVALTAVLHSLRRLIRHPAPTPSEFELLRAIVFYLYEFPELRHHRKESALLFPRMRARSREAHYVLDRLDDDHARGERMVHELEHGLLAWEQLGESRRATFVDACDRFADFYTAHLMLEEAEALPLAASLLEDADWRELDAAFAENHDPLAGAGVDDEYVRLLNRIVTLAPAWIGLTPKRGRAAGG